MWTSVKIKSHVLYTTHIDPMNKISGIQQYFIFSGAIII